jgi:hypothetical protein
MWARASDVGSSACCGPKGFSSPHKVGFSGEQFQLSKDFSHHFALAFSEARIRKMRFKFLEMISQAVKIILDYGREEPPKVFPQQI